MTRYFFLLLITILARINGEEAPVEKKGYRYETENVMETSASSLPIRTYRSIQEGYYPYGGGSFIGSSGISGGIGGGGGSGFAGGNHFGGVGLQGGLIGAGAGLQGGLTGGGIGPHGGLIGPGNGFQGGLIGNGGSSQNGAFQGGYIGGAGFQGGGLQSNLIGAGGYHPAFIGGGGFQSGLIGSGAGLGGGFFGGGASGIGLRSSGFGGNFEGAGFNGGGHLGTRGANFIGTGGNFIGAGGHSIGAGGNFIGGGPISHGGEVVDKSTYSDEKKNLNDGSFAKSNGQSGVQLNQGQTGFNQDKIGVQSSKGDLGYYNDQKDQKKVLEDEKHFTGGQQFNNQGQTADEKKLKAGHKKGHVIKGFKTSHHKDETGKTEEYFDEANDEGDNFNFHGQHGNFGEGSQAAYKGEHGDHLFNADERKKQGHYDAGQFLHKNNGDQGEYGQKKYLGSGQNYGVNNGIDQQSLLGHQEHNRFFKQHPFFH